MRTAARQQTSTPGHDSFLDVLANIVGILIILVVVAGLRARNATVKAASSDKKILAEITALDKEEATADSMRQDIFKLAAQIQDLDRERLIREEHRDRLAVALAAWQHKIQTHRSRLDAETQKTYDLGLQLSEAGAQLEELRRQRARAQAAEAAPIRIESYPTPLSKPVDGEEAHFQLRAGRVAFIPLEPLLEAFKARARQQAYKLLHQPELTDTVGPEGGFRLRYSLERHQAAERTEDGSLRMGSYARLKRWTLIPVSSQLGEPVDAALAEGSRFRQAVSGFDPERATITIWTYPDSFAEFRRLKEELFHLGFATAGRPLPRGVPIGGSPEGTKSAAE
jgi:hypothetical protein